MSVLAALFIPLLLVVVAYRIWQLVTLPRRIARGARGVRTAVGAVQRRQADKAAGKPVAPINFLGLGGLVLAIVGLIVAGTASAIVGLSMCVIGLGLLRLATNQRSAGQAGLQWQSGADPGVGGYGPPPTIGYAASNSPAVFGASQVTPGPHAPASGGAPGSRRFNSPPNWPPNPPGWSPGPDWSPDPSWPPAPPGWQFWT